MHIQRRSLFVAAAVMAAAAGCGSNGSDSSSTATGASTAAGGAGGDVGVYTWWADGSEKEGLDALVTLFKEQFPNNTFVNLAVAGGSGSNAKAKLASDLANGNPPDTFQAHAGGELTDYIDNEQVEPVDDIISALGGSSVYPKTLLDLITVGGHVYSVPCDIHRANMVWTNTSLLSKAGVSSDPTSVSAWLADLEKVKGSGVATPLSIGGTWTQTQLFESILAANLGQSAYTALFTKSGSWTGSDVTRSIDDLKQALTFANTASDGDDWVNATDMVGSGQAAYNLMGDWALAEFTSKGLTWGKEYSSFPLVGMDQTFGFLADSFTLPKGAKNPGGAKDWLNLVGGAEGQRVFNLKKGSIPPRTDVPASAFPEYQQKTMDSFKTDKIVPSIAHGAAVSLAWSSEINTAMSAFYQSKDTAKLQSALAAAHDKYAA
ncbi:glucose/mannose transport system substrate-binding protein [Propionibacterium cyclohexanicum]|uniref:Glucose/mannose transport system substrate-binding protein n=1 Tax=Propionibacterium cyclohexanicum TaxID=64702 RepID=A0A1H9R4G6_9ACTN|nr:glucose/mannose transport system substrate-binding protein [Propionibacterium cyclohexanicum]